MAEKVQCSTFAGQQGAGRPFDGGDHIAGLHHRTVLHMANHANRRIYELKRKLGGIETGDHARFATDHCKA
ncbi:hypothetical protein D3C85_1852760 [compost metagenome]